MACLKLVIAFTLMISSNVYLVHATAATKNDAGLETVNRQRAIVNVAGMAKIGAISDATTLGKLTKEDICKAGVKFADVTGATDYQQAKLEVPAASAADATKQQKVIEDAMKALKAKFTDGECKSDPATGCDLQQLYQSTIQEGLVFYETCGADKKKYFIFVLKKADKPEGSKMYLSKGGKCPDNTEDKEYPTGKANTQLCIKKAVVPETKTTAAPVATTTSGAKGLMALPIVSLSGVCLAAAALLRA